MYFVIKIYEKLNLYCVFASASEIGVLILYFSKLILGIQKNWKAL